MNAAALDGSVPQEGRLAAVDRCRKRAEGGLIRRLGQSQDLNAPAARRYHQAVLRYCFPQAAAVESGSIFRTEEGPLHEGPRKPVRRTRQSRPAPCRSSGPTRDRDHHSPARSPFHAPFARSVSKENQDAMPRQSDPAQARSDRGRAAGARHAAARPGQRPGPTAASSATWPTPPGPPCPGRR